VNLQQLVDGQSKAVAADPAAPVVMAKHANLTRAVA